MSVQLNMELSMLIQIEQQYGTCSDRTLHSMDTWLRNDPEPSWDRMVAALNTIEENALAAMIKRQHYHLMETPPTSPASHPGAASDDPSPSDTNSITTSSANQIPLSISATIRQLFPPHPTLSPKSTSSSTSPTSPPECWAGTTQSQGLPGPHAIGTAQSDPDRIESVIREASQLKDQFVRVLTHTKIAFSRKPAGFLEELCCTLTTLPVSDKFKHLQCWRQQRDHIMNATSVDDILNSGRLLGLHRLCSAAAPGAGVWRECTEERNE